MFMNWPQLVFASLLVRSLWGPLIKPKSFLFTPFLVSPCLCLGKVYMNDLCSLTYITDLYSDFSLGVQRGAGLDSKVEGAYTTSDV